MMPLRIPKIGRVEFRVRYVATRETVQAESRLSNESRLKRECLVERKELRSRVEGMLKAGTVLPMYVGSMLLLIDAVVAVQLVIPTERVTDVDAHLIVVDWSRSRAEKPATCHRSR